MPPTPRHGRGCGYSMRSLRRAHLVFSSFVGTRFPAMYATESARIMRSGRGSSMIPNRVRRVLALFERYNPCVVPSFDREFSTFFAHRFVIDGEIKIRRGHSTSMSVNQSTADTERWIIGDAVLTFGASLRMIGQHQLLSPCKVRRICGPPRDLNGCGLILLIPSIFWFLGPQRV